MDGQDDEPIDIHVWLAEHPFPNYYGETFLEPMRRVADAFTKAHPGYRVVLRGMDYREIAEAVADAVAQGEPPHLAEYYATAAQLALDTLTPEGQPYFTPIGPAIGDRAEILGEPVVVDAVEPVARDFFSHRGELLCLPVTVTTTVLLCNKTMLDAAGVPVPRTWGELEAACEAVTALDTGPAHGVTWPNHGWLFQQAVALQGGVLTDRDNGHGGRAETVDLASAEVLAWAEWWRRLSDKGLYRRCEDWPDGFGAFASQEVAFTLSSSKLTHDFVLAGEEAGFEVCAAAMPHNEAVARAGNVISGHGLWLADGLDEARREGALAFSQFLVNARNAAEWHRAVGFLPVTREARDLLEREGWFDRHPHQRVPGEALAASARTPATAGTLAGDFAGIQYAMTRAMDDVLDGADPRERFARATAEAQRLLDAHNAACLPPDPRTPTRLEVY
ncbi:extracellular solute-binding protein [Actinomadura sp. 7K534]|uniref:extracellular solute-binding protein n=1 Tax=Actinomadura sp. 7K534 TaxID=2530366 RepID=UPI001A9F8313|nr:extracellular solute-binding protein [Actinomadura sp. 7K534]